MQPNREAIKLSAFVPMQFIVNIDIPAQEPAVGGEGRNQIALNDRPFILQQITHAIITPKQNPQDFLDLIPVTDTYYQDGFYTLDWSLYEQSRFFKGPPAMADAGFGSVRNGNWIQLPAPLSLPGNETLHVVIRNLRDRSSEFQSFFTVQVIFHGIQRGGSQANLVGE